MSLFLSLQKGARYSVDGANTESELSQDFPIGETGAVYRNASRANDEKYPCPPWKKNLLHLHGMALYSLERCIVPSSNYGLVTKSKPVDP